MVAEKIQVAEVFKTEYGTVYQDDAAKRWVIDFAGKQAAFDYRCLLKLRDRIYNIDIEAKLFNPKASDFEIIFICACDHTYVLSLIQIVTLRELLQGTFVMLELNQIIHNTLYRIPA
jgi:hypothetical protein